MAAPSWERGKPAPSRLQVVLLVAFFTVPFTVIYAVNFAQHHSDGVSVTTTSCQERAGAPVLIWTGRVTRYHSTYPNEIWQIPIGWYDRDGKRIGSALAAFSRTSSPELIANAKTTGVISQPVSCRVGPISIEGKGRK